MHKFIIHIIVNCFLVVSLSFADVKIKVCSAQIAMMLTAVYADKHNMDVGKAVENVQRLGSEVHDKIAERHFELSLRMAQLTHKLSDDMLEWQRKNDVRLFAKWGWRNPKKNPILKKVRKIRDDVHKKIDAEVNANKKFAKLMSELRYFQQVDAENLSREDKLVFMWLIGRAEILIGEAVDPSLFRSSTLKDGFFKKAKELTSDIALFKQRVAGKGEPTEQGLRLRFRAEHLLSYKKKAHEAIVKQLERSVGKVFTHRLAELAREHNMELRKLIDIFDRIDKLGEGSSRAKGIYDQEVAYLTQLCVQYHVSPKEVVKKLEELYELGKNTRDGWHIEDAALVVLVELSYSQKIGIQEANKRFFEIVEYWKSKHSSYSFEDQDVARMTAFSFAHGLSAAQVFEEYYTVYNLGKKNLKGYYINDFVCISLIDYIHSHNVNPKAAVTELLDLMKRDNTDGLGLRDHEIFNVMSMARQYEMDSHSLLELAKKVKGIFPRFQNATVLNIMERALAVKKRASGKWPLSGNVLSRAEIEYVAFWTPKYLTLEDWHFVASRTSGKRRSSGRSRSRSSGDDDFISPTQALITGGSWINTDGNSFTPW